MVYDIFNFLTGYVYIKIEGSRLEQVLNSGVTFWNVTRKGYGCIYANVSLMAYYSLLKDPAYRITLIKERGLISIFKKLWKNKVLFFGLCISAMFIAVLSQMVINVEVGGYYSQGENEVKSYVEEWGMEPFSFKGRYNLDELCDFLMAKDNIAWASAGYDGVVLNVIIIEQRNIDDNTPCDILSSRQATIKKIDVYAGLKNKQIGDPVSPGEVLVTGIRQNNDMSVERIKSRAQVIGTFWESGTATLPANEMIISPTGNTITHRYIDFWGNKSYIENQDIGFTHYVSELKESKIGGNYGILPIKYVTVVYKEAALSYENKDVNEIASKAGTLALENAVQKVPTNAKIVNVDTSFNLDAGNITANVTVEVEADIGIIAPVE